MAEYERHDRLYHKAKAKGLPSRASFKIEEMIQKYKLAKAGDQVLDLGAAPGGWTVILAKTIGPGGRVYAIDLQALSKTPAPNVRFLQADIYGDIAKSWLQEQLAGKKLNVVCSDMSPKLSGIAFKDAYESYELCVKALDLAKQWLKPNGNLVTKIFPGEEFAAFIKTLRSYFKTVKTFEPEASRKTSREVYVLGMGFK